MLVQHSAVGKAFRMARDWCNTHNSTDFHLKLQCDKKTSRQYNAPTVSEVVALIVNDFGDGSPKGDVIVNNKISGPKSLTSNPKWSEIAEMLAYFPEQRSHDRPEIGTQVFKIKLIELLDDLTKNHIFDESQAVVYVIEFQKWGLPHAHILLWLEEHCKCMKPSQIDDIISAKLPSLVHDPEGYQVVTEYMLHGPCRKDARYAPCTNDGKCFKHFPKSFLEETILNEDGYPNYRRRDNKVTTVKGKFTYDNKHVVPHNRYLLLKYNPHINVEWCNRSKAIMYLFKYLNKGPDRATVVIQENVTNGNSLVPQQISEVDEIKNYLNCQILAPCEAVWHLFSFDIHYSYPTVMQLNFYLPNQNAITLRDSESLPALLERDVINIMMFTDWFKLNKRDPAARKHTYADIPKHYGIEGFEQILTVNNKLCATFKEACFSYGLLNDDKEWSHAISEASVWTLAPQLRDIFVTMLLLCDLTDEQIRNYCLIEIQKLLNRYGRPLADFQDLPRPNPKLLTNMDNRLIREALDFDMKKQG
ncbi:helicase [Tanacetum coccineum]